MTAILPHQACSVKVIVPLAKGTPDGDEIARALCCAGGKCWADEHSEKDNKGQFVTRLKCRAGGYQSEAATIRALLRNCPGVVERFDIDTFNALARRCADLEASAQRMRAVVDAARKMPRWTPKGGGAGTKHTYQIEACNTWALDAALTELDAAEPKEQT